MSITSSSLHPLKDIDSTAEIINALAAHEDNSSIQVLEELGTNSPDNEIREYT